jgi:hypothetical protein
MKRFLFSFAILLISSQYLGQNGTTNNSQNNSNIPIKNVEEKSIIIEESKSEAAPVQESDKDIPEISKVKEKEENQQQQQQGMLTGKIAVSKTSNYSRSLSNAEKNQLSLNINKFQLDSNSYKLYTSDELQTKFIIEDYNTDYLQQLIFHKKQSIQSNVNLSALICAGLIINDSAQLLKNELTFLKTNNYLSQNQIDFASDVLSSVDQNGTLITHAFSDTYALLYDQKVNAHRNDVNLVCLDFLVNKNYAQRMDKNLTLPLEMNSENGKDRTPVFSGKVDTLYFSKLLRLNKDKKIFIATTVPKEYFKAAHQDLYWSGLTMSNFLSLNTDPEQLALLWSKQWKKSSLACSSKIVFPLAKNYLGSLVILQTYFDEIDDPENELKIKKEIKLLKKTFDLK